MCGIVGFLTNKNINNEEIINNMIKKIKHRGPDDDGYFLDNFTAIGNTRLSIIDLSSKGKQPMFNETKTIAVIFNGEIYNFIELKKTLIDAGHIFNSNTDTEVLVHGYEEWKQDLPNKLRGMFAFVIYDKKNNKLFGARDHFGIKPFYYYLNNNDFVFGSEIKAIFEYTEVKREFNENVLFPYLTFGFNPLSETFYKNIYSLEPGEYFFKTKDSFQKEKYYDVTFEVKNVTNTEIKENITDSIKKHLISDVEIGTSLSSGIDSTIITSIAKPNKTFTVGYKNKKYSELELAKNYSQSINIKNYSKIINPVEYLKVIPKVIYALDEPLVDPSCISLYFVSSLAKKEKIKVLLSGEGADEFFGGYNTYNENTYNFYNKIPFILRNLIANIAIMLPDFKGKEFLIRRGIKKEKYYMGNNRTFTDNMANKLLHTNKKSFNFIDKTLFNNINDNVTKMQIIDIKYFLPKDIFFIVISTAPFINNLILYQKHS